MGVWVDVGVGRWGVGGESVHVLKLGILVSSNCVGGGVQVYTCMCMFIVCMGCLSSLPTRT